MPDRSTSAVDPLPDRWAAQWNRTLEWMGLGMVFIPVGERLFKRYSEPGRHYHDARHALACVKALDDYPGAIGNQDAVELALWFHDAAYSARATPRENREGSAELFRGEFQLLAGDLVDINEVCRLIIATRHHRQPEDPDAALAMDIDLLIFAADQVRYDAYAGELRREYPHSDDQSFRSQRAEFLRTFLRRRSIYWTRHFRKLIEKRARNNIERELAALERV
jgi:predicted metal-dependent HD superfamily phosphohydrolase